MARQQQLRAIDWDAAPAVLTRPLHRTVTGDCHVCGGAGWVQVTSVLAHDGTETDAEPWGRGIACPAPSCIAGFVELTPYDISDCP